MKKWNFVFMLIAATASATSFADWKPTGYKNSATESYYYDPTTIQKSEDGTARVWTMHDFSKKGKDGVLSMTSQIEIICAKSDFRSRSMLVYSGHKAQGSIIDSWIPKDQWEPIPPGSPLTALHKLVCQ